MLKLLNANGSWALQVRRSGPLLGCDFLGGDYETINEILQEDACEELCIADKHCTHFTFNPRMTICYLRKFKQPWAYEKTTELTYSSSICGFVIDRVKLFKITHIKQHWLFKQLCFLGFVSIKVVYDVKLLDQAIKSFEWRIGTGKGINYKWGTGCLFIPGSSSNAIDNDIVEVGNSANCAVSCFFNKLCTHFNYLKNRCYLKTTIKPQASAPTKIRVPLVVLLLNG